MSVALVNGRVLRKDRLTQGRCVLIENGRILDIVAPSDRRARRAERYDLGGQLLLPGFIDSQVNGGGGVLFNDAPTVETIRAIGRAHRRFGTTGFLPTLISADLDVVARAIAAVRSALEAGVPGVLGIHIEGPFLNVARKGVHDPAKLRDLDASALGLLTSLTGGRTLVTLAPEVTTPQIIEKLVASGVVVSAGHTNATYAEIGTALRHGLRGFTHLFNAMSQLTGREPGADRKSTRLNSSHSQISYAVFCLKKKKQSTYCDVYSVIIGRLSLASRSAIFGHAIAYFAVPSLPSLLRAHLSHNHPLSESLALV